MTVGQRVAMFDTVAPNPLATFVKVVRDDFTRVGPQQGRAKADGVDNGVDPVRKLHLGRPVRDGSSTVVEI